MFQYLYAIAKKLNAIYHPDLTYNAYDVSHLFLKDQSRGQSTEATEDLSIRMKVPN